MEIVSKTLTKIKIFQLFFREIMIFRKFEQNKDYRKFLLNSGSSIILTKFDKISDIFDKNRDFRKSWLKSRFSKISTAAKISKIF